MKFVRTVSVLAAFAILTTQAFAQSEEDEDAKILDKVIVQGQQDDAMAAFRAGDFATAEVEFMENAFCALRQERLRISGVESIQTNQARADVSAAAESSSAGVSADANGNVSVNPAASSGGPSADGLSNAASNYNAAKPGDNTCENRGFQIYMAGLSQIQLGKVDEALESFERATNMSRVLYDAHYRIGLIKLLEGDTKEAGKQLKRVESILDRCKRCEAKQEIIDRRDHLTAALSGAVAME